MLDSVRVRLTVWYSAVLAIVLILVSAVTFLIVRKTSMQRTDADLIVLADSFLTTFRAELADAQDTKSPAVLSAARQAMIEHHTNSDVFAVLGSDGKMIANSNDLSTPGTKSETWMARAFGADGFRQFAEESEGRETNLEILRAGRLRLRAYARQFPANGQSYLLVILHSLHAQFETLETIRLTFTWMILLGLLLAGTSGYFLARKSLAPVTAMGGHARRIGATNLHERLPVLNANDELGQLATIFNDLLDRLDRSFEQQKQFIADASHELRTPLAILRGETEVAMSRPGRTAEEYLESLGVLHEQTSRLIKIVEDLFTLTRADSGQYELSPEEVYVEEVVAECAHSVRTLAQEKGIELKVDASSECLVLGDAALLRRMILNLLDNAIKYTPEGGRVKLWCTPADGSVEVHVEDSGPGIPSELQGRIFERFFRADPARARSGREGGAGLGLSIALWIAQAHKGRLELIRSDATGSHFAIYLPGETAVPAAMD